MSNTWLNRVFGANGVKGSARLVLLALADRADESGRCYPSVADTAARAGLGVRYTHKVLAELVAAGHVQVVQAGGGVLRGSNGKVGRTNVYQLVQQPCPPEHCSTEHCSTEHCPPGSETLSPRTGEPSYNPTKKKTKETPRAADPLTWTLETGWQGIQQPDREEWGRAYPAVDVDQELAAASAWLKANPTKAVKRAWRRFVVGWLARTQQNGGSRRAAHGNNGRSNHRPAPRATPKLEEQIEMRVFRA